MLGTQLRSALGLLLVLSACQPAPAPRSPEPASSSGDTTDGDGEHTAPRADGPAEDPPPPEDAEEAVHEGACDGLARLACRLREGCVVDGADCRPAQNACERLVPASFPGHPGQQTDVSRGDPCAALDRGCAYRASSDSCVPFAALMRCPRARDDVPADVFCQHPDQTALSCDYPGVRCGCRPPAPYCGGAAPPPWIGNVAPYWACMEDPQPNGCPVDPPTEGARCRAPEAAWCSVGCGTVFRCVQGRWRGQPIPPRP